MSRLGFGIAAALGPDVAGAVAPEIERAGFASFWSNDTRDTAGLPILAAAQRATRRIRLGVGVCAVDLRPPSEIVRSIGDLGLTRERTIVGVGSGRAERPLEAVRAAVAELRAALPAGSAIAVAALGPRMCRLAGGIADAVLLNWMTPERIRWARRRIEEGARRAGRDPASVTVASYVRVAVGRGAPERLAAEAARYARNPSYARSLGAMAVDAVTVGIASEDGSGVRAALEAYREVLDETVVRALPSSPDVASVLEVARAARA